MTDRTDRRFGLMLGCAEPERLAQFWSDALDYVKIGSAGNYVALYPRVGDGPRLLLQQVDEPKAVKNRMHIDIDANDMHAEAARLTELGARRVGAADFHEHGAAWIVMEDPEGNEFCVCEGGSATSATPQSP